MESLIHLDTHAVVWLYAGQVDRFPSRIRALLENESLGISPMVQLELQYLFEIDRLGVPSAEIVTDLEARLGLAVAETPFRAVAAQAFALSWTRDPFDRLIVAQALVEGAALVTADRTLHQHLRTALWD